MPFLLSFFFKHYIWWSVKKGTQLLLIMDICKNCISKFFLECNSCQNQSPSHRLKGFGQSKGKVKTVLEMFWFYITSIWHQSNNLKPFHVECGKTADSWKCPALITGRAEEYIDRFFRALHRNEWTPTVFYIHVTLGSRFRIYPLPQQIYIGWWVYTRKNVYLLTKEVHRYPYSQPQYDCRLERGHSSERNQGTVQKRKWLVDREKKTVS